MSYRLRSRGTYHEFEPIQASGGTVLETMIDGTLHKVHYFTSVGSHTFTLDRFGSNPEINYLIVGGGGSGGASQIEEGELDPADPADDGTDAPDIVIAGGGGDAVFVENDQTVTTNYTIPANKNAMSTGPVTVDTGVTVTVSSGSRYVVI